MAEPLRPYGLDRARVAHRQNYPIAANWKLTIENYCECYHCAPAHPEYSVGHGRAVPAAEFAGTAGRGHGQGRGGRPHAPRAAAFVAGRGRRRH